MSAGWSSLPLLPLGCVLQHLSLEDALAAMSTCRHWRAGLLMYEGRRKTLKLNAKQLDKCMFLAHVYKKHTRSLHVNVADCGQAELALFMHRVLPQFFETLQLQEIMFIGPGCVQQMPHENVKLDRIVIESLVFKHSHSIQKFALMNCELDTVDIRKVDKEMHDNVEYYSRGLRFDSMSPADAVLSRNVAEAMMFSSLQHICVEYELVSTSTLETLSSLPEFRQLSVAVRGGGGGGGEGEGRARVNWRRALALYPRGLRVALSLIALPEKKIEEVMENVLVEGLPLTSLKLLFCKNLYPPLIRHVSRLHKATLREFVAVDAPHETSCQRAGRAPRATDIESCNVNPLILLCWQCTHLKRLVLHGYWVWQYDVVGFVRLRKSLEQLELSAVFGRSRRPPPASLSPVRGGEPPAAPDPSFVKQVNEYTEFKWSPTAWARLHPALRPRAPPAQRSAYILLEAAAT